RLELAGFPWSRSWQRRSRAAGRSLGSTALAPMLRLGRRNGGVCDGAPVERDLRILLLQRRPCRRGERLPPELHAGRRAKPVQHTRADLAAAAGRRLDQVEVLVAALVPGEAEKRHLPGFSLCGLGRSRHRLLLWFGLTCR